jgi:methyl-coenzyme M reductase beta subunit
MEKKNMAKYKETVDLYDDEGKLLKSKVALEKVSPLVNPAIKKIIDLTKKTVAVNLAGVENGVKTGAMGKGSIPGRGLNLNLVKDVDAIADKIKKLVSVEDGDDTKVTKVGGGKLLLIEVPSARMAAASTYDAASTSVASATVQAIIDNYDVGMFDGPMVKSAVWGAYPQTMDMQGGNIITVLSIPQNNEGLGYSLRNVSANIVAMMTHRNAMQTAALSCTFEQAGEFEMGMAIGPFERAQLLGYARSSRPERRVDTSPSTTRRTP